MSKTSRREFLATAAGAAVIPALGPLPKARSSSNLNIDWGFPEGAIRVGLNENPLGPAPKAAKAIAETILSGNRYIRSQTLAERVAKLHGVDPEWLVFGCGSGEILRNIPWAFAQDGEVVTAREAYRDLPAESERMKIPVHMIPVDKEFRHDLNAMANAINSKTRVVNVTNPNNPTGTVLDVSDLKKFADAVPKDAVYVVDEAYIHFAPHADASALVKERNNILVLRTFSKIFGLAGLRVGYAVGHPDLIKKLRRYALRNNINALGFVGAIAALDDTEHMERYRALLREGKEYFQRELASMSAEYVPSQTPFFLLNTGRDGEQVEKELQGHKVFVRRGKDWDLPPYIRITYGTMEENRAVIVALKKVLKRT